MATALTATLSNLSLPPSIAANPSLPTSFSATTSSAPTCITTSTVTVYQPVSTELQVPALTAAILGAVLGAALLISWILMFLLWYEWRKERQKRQTREEKAERRSATVISAAAFGLKDDGTNRNSGATDVPKSTSSPYPSNGPAVRFYGDTESYTTSPRSFSPASDPFGSPTSPLPTAIPLLQRSRTIHSTTDNGDGDTDSFVSLDSVATATAVTNSRLPQRNLSPHNTNTSGSIFREEMDSDEGHGGYAV